MSNADVTLFLQVVSNDIKTFLKQYSVDITGKYPTAIDFDFKLNTKNVYMDPYGRGGYSSLEFYLDDSTVSVFVSRYGYVSEDIHNPQFLDQLKKKILNRLKDIWSNCEDKNKTRILAILNRK